MRHAIILTPGTEGGIGRLMSYLEAPAPEQLSNWRVELFTTHGSVRESLVRFPFRLLRFATLCLFGKIDLCHINVASRGSTLRKLFFAAACRTTRTPYVLHLHGGGYREFYASGGMVRKAAIRWLFANAARVIILGTIWRDFVRDEIGVPEARIDIVPNAVPGPSDDELSRIVRADPPLIVFLGLVSESKGTNVLLTALTSEKLRNLEWHAVLAGNGEVERFRKMADNLGLSTRVELPGWCGPDEVNTYLRQGSILVLPSLAENLPLSMLEGMAWNLCPVVTPVGAVEEVIVSGKNGLLVPVSDAGALADALHTLLSDPERRKHLAEEARRTFKAAYDINDYPQRLATVYDRALARPAPDA